MSDVSEEYRLLNNLAVLLDVGWEIRTAIKAIRDDVPDSETIAMYDDILQRLDRAEDLGDILARSPLIENDTSRLIIRSGQSSGMLQDRLTRTAELVSFSFQGGWDPRRRFLETWAVLVDAGISLEDALTALTEDFRDQPLGTVASDFLAGVKKGRELYEVAQQHPEFFSMQARQLLQHGEKRNMARALRSMIQLV